MVDPCTETPIYWHHLPIDEVYGRLVTGPGGLTSEEAAMRLQQFGPNTLPARKPPGILTIFIHQFKSPLIYILLIAALVSFLLGDFKDGFFILAVVLLNAVIGLFQEWKAEQGADKLRSLLRIKAVVRRDGKEISINAADLVPGDLVMLESGNRVPADIRLVHASNLNIDESLLTGESVTVEKAITVLDSGAPLGERKNMAFGGTTVINGRGEGVVTATGISTEVGNIAKAVAETGFTKPPLLIRMEKLSRNIGILVIFACILMAVIMVSQGASPTEVFFLAVALSVSAIPEGLPVAITVALSIGLIRMGRRNVIVRRLAAVESLGSCTMIATDKTGTLTVNEQTVRRLILPRGTVYNVTGAGYTEEGEVTPGDGGLVDYSDDPGLKRLAVAGVVCNEGSLYKDDDEWVFNGDSMDVALLSFAYKAGIDPDAIHNSIKIEATVPFEPERRYSAVYYTDDSGKIKVAAKGAFEVLSKYCSEIPAEEGAVPFDREAAASMLAILTKNGYRALAFAEGAIDAMPEEGIELATAKIPLTYLGVAGFIDPIRPGVGEAVCMCREAGVEVAMITGDHPDTAFAIASEIGFSGDESKIVTGDMLERLESSSPPEFFEKIRESRIFARVSPVQKLQIVDAMVKSGHFVAVTGDGVNDAPALKKANIGVAMGSGTDVTKDTASMIIADDDFSSIVAGIEEGRFAYDNIRKVTYLLISTGFAEIVLFILALLAGLPLPLLAVQLLWLNLVTNGIQDIALAFEKGEEGTMKKKPRDPKEGVFNRLMIQETILSGAIIGLIAFSTYFWLMTQGWTEPEARNVLVLLMVLLENFHALNCRSEQRSLFKNPLSNNYYLVFGIIAAQGIHILAMMTPFMQDLLSIGPVDLRMWLLLLVISSAILMAMELFKFIRSGIEKRHENKGNCCAC